MNWELIISCLALGVSVFTYFKHDKKIKAQEQIINDYQIFNVYLGFSTGYQRLSINSLKCKIFSLDRTLNSKCSKSRFFTFKFVESATCSRAFFSSPFVLIPCKAFKKSRQGSVCWSKNMLS